jgi:thiamine-monophosphate kinase
MLSVAHAGEFGLISRVVSRLGSPGRAVLVGPGDDAALVAAPDGRVVASVDLLIEGRHFRRDWADAADIGRRAAAANLADISAMGGTATALLVGLAAPPDLDAAWAEELAVGLAEEAALVGASVAGGDTTSAATVMISVTALGHLEGLDPVLRSGARPGDVVALAGRVGHAAAGYTVLSRGFRTPKLLVDAYRRPEVPYALGPAGARAGATAMIDVSDGLIADLGHIATASGVRFDISKDHFLVPEQMRDAARALGVDAYQWLLAGGDDHALAATFPPSAALPEGWRPIGSVSAGEGVTVDGKRWIGSPGWDHFRA